VQISDDKPLASGNPLDNSEGLAH